MHIARRSQVLLVVVFFFFAILNFISNILKFHDDQSIFIYFVKNSCIALKGFVILKEKKGNRRMA